MAQPTNTFDSYDAVGNREDLADIIYDISPTDTPFISMIPRVEATGVYHEWQTDALAAVDGNNAAIEGDDATFDAISPTTRIGNRCQISDKTIVVSGTQDEVDTAGRDRESAYQTLKRGRELRRDMETILLSNQASVTGNSTTARKLGGIESWYETSFTNESTLRGATGANGGFSGGNTTAATDGTQRALTETLLKAAVKTCWDQGGNPDVVMLGSAQKQTASGFTGTNQTKFVDMSDGGKRLQAAIDIYESDFGTLRFIPNRFQRARTGHVLDTDFWALAVLRDFRSMPLAKTGDNMKWLLLTEYTLESRNEASSAPIADLS